MKNLIFIFCLLIWTVNLLVAQGKVSDLKKQTSVDLYFLGGQSNMEGFGENSHLPPSLENEIENVWIFHGNPVEDGASGGGEGQWAPLAPGHGIEFSATKEKNHLSGRFGVELTFAQTLLSHQPHQKIALIKYARGGSSIDSLAADVFGCWAPDFKGKNGVNQYDHFLATLRYAFANTDIDGDGQEELLVPKGIIWMQGESDATIDEAVANRYYDNLKMLMELIRAALRVDDLPVVIGKISDSWDNEQQKVWTYGELVQYGQEKFVKFDRNARIVRSTLNYQYSDPWHYDSAAYLDLGKKFAEAVLEMQ